MTNRILILSLLLAGSLAAQTMAQIQLPRPVPAGKTVVIGFLGFVDRWDDPDRGVRKVALHLRGQGLATETFSNHNLRTAKNAVLQALDSNRNGRIDPTEAASARVILYGQSLGGNATVKMAKYLENLQIPILLTVQIDSFGLHDRVIPGNVRQAANFYQKERMTLRGEQEVRAADPTRTKILGNFEYHYPLWVELLGPEKSPRRIFGGGHARMEGDPLLWARVEALILDSAGRR